MVGCQFFLKRFYVHTCGRLLSSSVQVRLEAARLEAHSRHPVLIGLAMMHHTTQMTCLFAGGPVPKYIGQAKIGGGILAGGSAVDSVRPRPLVRSVGGASARVRFYVTTAV